MRGISLTLGCFVDELQGNLAGDPFWVLPILGPGASSTTEEWVLPKER